MNNIFGSNTKKLGFGLMRLPQADLNDWGSIDIEMMKQMVDHFLEEGFTYFDTALMYCGCNSENAVKTAITDRYPREAFTLADKMHGDFFKTREEIEQVFLDQLKKTGVDYFDYYLLHDIGEDHYRKYTEFGCFEWLKQKKEDGFVKHIGFSYHDTPELLDRVLTEHPEMEFVQIQLNYLDWNSEGIQSRRCLEVCVKHDKPVIVMEPVKGGTLAKDLPQEAEQLFMACDPKASYASWAIRFAASQPNVRIVLSGMSDMDMLLDNTGYMKEFQPLTEEEQKMCLKAADMINAGIEIPCTACAYCVEGCPMNIPIPKYFSLYNTDKLEGTGKIFTPQGEYYMRLTENFGKASECIECGNCEDICPQHLPIRENLKKVAAHFEK